MRAMAASGAGSSTTVLLRRAGEAVFGQLAGALAHSHEVIHRDIKPENVLVCDAAPASPLSDFGSSTGAGPRKVRGEWNPRLYAPKMSLAKGYGHAAGLWSLERRSSTCSPASTSTTRFDHGRRSSSRPWLCRSLRVSGLNQASPHLLMGS